MLRSLVMAVVDLEAVLTDRLQQRIASGELTTTPRAIPKCPSCRAHLAGSERVAIKVELAGDSVSGYYCGACKIRLPFYLIDRVQDYDDTGGLKRRRGRHPKVAEPKKLVIRMEGSKLEAFRDRCSQRGISMNDVVRAFVDRYLDEDDL